jgi:cytochrome b561
MLNPAPRYTPVAIALHWLLALLLVGTFSFGLYMVDLPFSPARVKQFNWHKWAGITILALSLLRLLWRLAHRPPAPPAELPRWQHAAAQAAHWAMYALFFAVPLAGWAYSSAAGFPVVWFGVLPLPDWVPHDKALAESLKMLHHRLAFALAGVVGLHLAAVLYHQLQDGGTVMRRMLPGRT